jgi:hypothetical protein
MFIGTSSVDFISELNVDLAQKTLVQASNKLNVSFARFVPWMCLVCLTDDDLTGASILFDEYDRGELLIQREKLNRIAGFLRKEGRSIVDDAIGPTAGLTSSDTISVVEDIEVAQPEAIACYAAARTLLLESDPLLRGLFKTLIHFVVPVRSLSRKFGYSTHLARGVVFLSFPEDEHPEIALAIDLAHELGHQALMVFQSADPLLTSSLDEPLWSGIRQAYRPAIQCMQAAAALCYMTILTDGLIKRSDFTVSERAYIEKNHHSQVEKMKATILSINEACTFTGVGRRIMEDFERVAGESS